jgi:hypothetical protein
MSARPSVAISALALALAFVVTPAAQKRAGLRMPWGDPDLQGTWTNGTATPLERPSQFAGKPVLGADDLVGLEEPNADAPLKAGDPGNYNEFWYDRGRRTNRTSLIVDPPDGKLPPLSAAGQSQAAAKAASRQGRGPADSWEDRSLYERCITRGMPGAMLPGFYNHNYQIFQAPGYVAILIEMIHDVRIIPLDHRPHAPASIRQWLGDARGHWDGDTLVVDTTNFSDQTVGAAWTVGGGTGRTLHLTERFKRTDADSIDYEFTVEDAIMLTRSWTASIPMRKLGGPIFEYACHEGNYGMLNLLGAARADEAASGQPATKR